MKNRNLCHGFLMHQRIVWSKLTKYRCTGNQVTNLWRFVRTRLGVQNQNRNLGHGNLIRLVVLGVQRGPCFCVVFLVGMPLEHHNIPLVEHNEPALTPPPRERTSHQLRELRPVSSDDDDDDGDTTPKKRRKVIKCKNMKNGFSDALRSEEAAGSGLAPKAEWSQLAPHIHKVLWQMGRLKGEQHTSNKFKETSRLPQLTFPGLTDVISSLRDEEYYTADVSTWVLDGKGLKELADQAKVYHAAMDDVDVGLNTLLRYDRSRNAEWEDYHRAQLTAVVGPVHIVSNHQAKPLHGDLRTHHSVLMVSIAGINFNYEPADVMRYVTRTDGTPWTHDEALRLVTDDETDETVRPWRRAIADLNARFDPKRTDLTPVGVDEETGVAGFALQTDAVKQQMRRVWFMVLHAVGQEGAEVAVLNAIGCGMFRGPFSGVPRLWAESLRYVLEHHRGTFRNIRDVFVCFPSKPMDAYNYEQFKKALDGFDPEGLCVTLAGEHSMLSVAHLLSVRRSRNNFVAILNPSDVYAVRKGHIGMFFDGKDCSIGLEELLGVATTAVLTMHRSINPRLWEDNSRWKSVDLSALDGPDGSSSLPRLVPPTTTTAGMEPPRVCHFVSKGLGPLGPIRIKKVTQ